MQQARAETLTNCVGNTSQLAAQKLQNGPSKIADISQQDIAQRQRQDAADKGLQNRQLKAIHQMTQQSEHLLQLKHLAIRNGAPTLQRIKEKDPLQEKTISTTLQSKAGTSPVTMLKANNTGLPDNLKSGIESLSGMSMDHVRVHYNSAQPAQLNAHAYAQGSDIHIAPGQEQHLPHEAWHVVQQAQGRVQPTMQMKSGEAVNDDARLEAEADTMGAKAHEIGVSQRVSRTTEDRSGVEASIMLKSINHIPSFSSGGNLIQKYGLVLQGAFVGIPFAHYNPVAVNYPNHSFTTGGVTANANCGTHNRVVTAGERQNRGSSQPGTPSNMTAYQYGFSRTGGLVRDPALSQASTKLHLINHRFEDSGNTQGVASNIMLGSKRANNPTHLHRVENPVLNALSWNASQLNLAYEAALGNAQRLADYDNGGMVTYWTNGTEPATNVLPTYNRQSGWIYPNGEVGRNPPPNVPSKYKKTSTGSALANTPDGYFVETNNPAFLKKHLWVDYDVQANYSGAPNYITLNIAHERLQNGGAVAPNDQSIENQIADFEANWKDNAVPANFTCNASYYMASFIPATPYHRATEAAETIASDT
jgi:hypothetical protein